MPQTLTIGVLGAAKISPEALLQPALDTSDVEVRAVAARDRARAEAQAREFNIAQVLDSYEQVLESDVDAIYNPLPIHLHRAWTIRALRAGKHVLCEKPFACNAAEAAEMVAVADETGKVLMEAFHWRYHPLAARVRAILNSGEVGAIEFIDAAFTVAIDPADDVRHAFELGGGALMDLGCYPVQWVRFVADAEPTVTAATMREGRPKVDVVTDIDLAIARGAGEAPIRGHIYTAMDAQARFASHLEVRGSEGVLRVENPLAPHSGHELRVTPKRGDARTETVDGRTTYHHQLEAFRDAVLRGAEFPTGGEDAIATMRFIDAAYETAGLPRRGH